MAKVRVHTLDGDKFEVEPDTHQSVNLQAREIAEAGAVEVVGDGSAAYYHPPHQIKKVYFME